MCIRRERKIGTRMKMKKMRFRRPRESLANMLKRKRVMAERKNLRGSSSTMMNKMIMARKMRGRTRKKRSEY